MLTTLVLSRRSRNLWAREPADHGAAGAALNRLQSHQQGFVSDAECVHKIKRTKRLCVFRRSADGGEVEVEQMTALLFHPLSFYI